jgi:hypothetical protein
MTLSLRPHSAGSSNLLFCTLAMDSVWSSIAADLQAIVSSSSRSSEMISSSNLERKKKIVVSGQTWHLFFFHKKITSFAQMMKKNKSC